MSAPSLLFLAFCTGVEITWQLTRIKFETPDATAAAFLPVESLGLVAFLPMPPFTAASRSVLTSATTGPLGATPLYLTASSAQAGPIQSLADAVTTFTGLGVIWLDWMLLFPQVLLLCSNLSEKNTAGHPKTQPS